MLWDFEGRFWDHSETFKRFVGNLKHREGFRNIGRRLRTLFEKKAKSEMLFRVLGFLLNASRF